jgi:hypothetical protein
VRQKKRKYGGKFVKNTLITVSFPCLLSVGYEAQHALFLMGT